MRSLSRTSLREVSSELASDAPMRQFMSCLVDRGDACHRRLLTCMILLQAQRGFGRQRKPLQQARQAGTGEYQRQQDHRGREEDRELAGGERLGRASRRG
jgi:hypothetical protein